MTYPHQQPAQHPQQPVGHPYPPQAGYGYAQPAPLTPDAERWNRARGRHLGFGVVWLIMSVLNLGWPIVAGATIFVAIASGGTALGGGDTLLVLGIVYMSMFPLLVLLSLLTALRSQWLHKRLKPFGRSALAGIIIGWIGFGLAMINLISIGWTMGFFFTSA